MRCRIFLGAVSLPIMVGTHKSFQSEPGTPKFFCSQIMFIPIDRCRNWARGHDWVLVTIRGESGPLIGVANVNLGLLWESKT